MKKITILALHLGYGGIEKAISSLSNSLCEEYGIEIISTYKLYDNPAFKLDSKVNVSYLITNIKPNHKELKASLRNFNLFKIFKELFISIKILFLRKYKMIKAIKKCDSDIIISTRYLHNKWLGKYGSKNSLKIGWEHNHHNNNNKYIRKVVNSAKKLDFLVLVSESLRDFYKEKLKRSKCECVYIPNTLDEIPTETSKLDTKNIISVGRLSKEKGFVDLIEVFKNVSLKCPDWKLNIIGDGLERDKIEDRIKTYKLEDNVILHGYRDKKYINKMLSKSSIYVMCSYTESFGIVLLEAFSYGIPAVAFDCAIGAKELISNNWDGYLISDRDKEKMAKKIVDLINNDERRNTMGINARKKSLRYTSDIIKDKWKEILK